MSSQVAAASPSLRANYRLGLVLMIASTIAWSTAGLFTRLIPHDAWTMLAWRGLFGGLGIIAVMLMMGGSRALRDFGRLGWAGWAFGLLGAGAMICFITSLRYTTVAHSAVIYATLPFLAGALGWIVLGERPSLGAAAASVAALVGVGLMVGFGVEGGIFGDVLSLAMTIGMAVLIVIARFNKGIPTMAAAAVSALASAAAATPFAHGVGVTSHDLWLLVGFGLVNSAVGLALFTLGSRLLPPIETALLGALDAPLAPVWVWLAFGETPGLVTFVGGGIVFIAVAAHVLNQALQASSMAT